MENQMRISEYIAYFEGDWGERGSELGPDPMVA